MLMIRKIISNSLGHMDDECYKLNSFNESTFHDHLVDSNINILPSVPNKKAEKLSKEALEILIQDNIGTFF